MLFCIWFYNKDIFKGGYPDWTIVLLCVTRTATWTWPIAQKGRERDNCWTPRAPEGQEFAQLHMVGGNWILTWFWTKTAFWIPGRNGWERLQKLFLRKPYFNSWNNLVLWAPKLKACNCQKNFGMAPLILCSLRAEWGRTSFRDPFHHQEIL